MTEHSGTPRRLTRRTALKIASASGLGAVLASCLPGGTPEAPKGAPGLILEGDTLNIGQGVDSARLAPNAPPRIATGLSIDLGMYETLVTFKRPPAYPELEPMLAERWENIKPDQWRFHLRKGVKFHNGADFDADAVVYTFQKTLEWSGSGIQQVDKVVPVDKHTVDFFTKGPWFLLLYRLNSTMLMEHPSWGSKPDAAMGTGPYKFVEWRKGDRVIMERNENWWGGKPAYKRIVFRGIPETSTRVSGLLAGELDVIRPVAAQDIPRINAAKDLQVLSVPSVTYTGMAMRQDGIYANKGFRQALNYAVDKDALIKGVMGGLAAKLNGQRNDKALGADPSVQDYPYDVAKAKQLIKDSGYKGEKVLVESGRGITFKDAELTQAVGGYLEAVGLNVELNIMEAGVYAAKFSGAGEADQGGLLFAQSGNIIPDVENSIDDIMVRGVASSRWTHPRAKELRTQLAAAVDMKDRVRIGQEIVRLMREEAPILFLVKLVDAYGVRKTVDWTPRPDTPGIWPREFKYKG